MEINNQSNFQIFIFRFLSIYDKTVCRKQSNKHGTIKLKQKNRIKWFIEKLTKVTLQACTNHIREHTNFRWHNQTNLKWLAPQHAVFWLKQAIVSLKYSVVVFIQKFRAENSLSRQQVLRETRRIMQTQRSIFKIIKNFTWYSPNFNNVFDFNNLHAQNKKSVKVNTNHVALPVIPWQSYVHLVCGTNNFE